MEQINQIKYSGMEFSEQENEANNLFLDLLQKSINSTSEHFFKSNLIKFKKEIEQTKLYQIIKQMPKGGCLHLHQICLYDPDFVSIVPRPWGEFTLAQGQQSLDTLPSKILSHPFAALDPSGLFLFIFFSIRTPSNCYLTSP